MSLPSLEKVSIFSTTRGRVASWLSCILLLLPFAPAAHAQQPQPSGWEWQNPLPQGNTINSVRFAADKRHGWAVGSDGAILRTRITIAATVTCVGVGWHASRHTRSLSPN